MNPSTPRRRDRTQVGCIAGLGVLWALAQPLLALSDSGFAVSAFGNGIAFAVYAAYLYAIRGGRGNFIRAVIVVAFGACHIFWMVRLSDIVRNLLPGLSHDDFHVWLAVTGIVLGVLVAALSERWFVLVPVAGGTAVAIVLAVIGATAAWGGAVVIGMSIACLHLGLLAALVPDTLQRLSERPGRDACQSCGYDLCGLPARACPECGTSPSR